MKEEPTPYELKLLRERGHLQIWKAMVYAEHAFPNLEPIRCKENLAEKDEALRDMSFFIIKQFLHKLGLKVAEMMFDLESGILDLAKTFPEYAHKLDVIERDKFLNPPQISLLLHMYRRTSKRNFFGKDECPSAVPETPNYRNWKASAAVNCQPANSLSNRPGKLTTCGDGNFGLNFRIVDPPLNPLRHFMERLRNIERLEF